VGKALLRKSVGVNPSQSLPWRPLHGWDDWEMGPCKVTSYWLRSEPDFLQINRPQFLISHTRPWSPTPTSLLRITNFTSQWRTGQYFWEGSWIYKSLKNLGELSKGRETPSPTSLNFFFFSNYKAGGYTQWSEGNSPLALAQVSDLWFQLGERFRGQGELKDLLLLLFFYHSGCRFDRRW